MRVRPPLVKSEGLESGLYPSSYSYSHSSPDEDGDEYEDEDEDG